MKTVFICHGWMTGEEDFNCAVFEKEEDAIAFCQQQQKGDEYGYQYNYSEWELK